MDVALTASLVSPIVEAEANGPHAVIVDLARGLRERGHRTTIYAAAGSAIGGARIVQVPVSADAAEAMVRPSGPPPAVDMAADFARLFAVARANGHDVLSQHAFDSPAIAADPGIPVLHTLHLPPTVPAVVAAARATTAPLAAVSASARDEWHRAGVQTARLLRNGVPDRGYRSTAPVSAALIAGRISPEKGTAIGICAARAAGLTPWVVGDVYDESYFADAVRPQLSSAEYFGAVERPRLADLMGQAAVLIMPIEWPEPFGLVAAEAQMAGCPIVAYRRGALAEVVEDGVSGLLVNPGDQAALVRALDRALDLSRERVRMSALARLGLAPMVTAYEAALASLT